MWAGQLKMRAQDVEQRAARIGVDLSRNAIEAKSDLRHEGGLKLQGF
jgi:hypothetical protein